jgi:acyl-CoA thioesterase II
MTQTSRWSRLLLDFLYLTLSSRLRQIAARVSWRDARLVGCQPSLEAAIVNSIVKYVFEPLPTDQPHTFTWEPSEFLLTPASTLQGGAGLGVAMRAVEIVTGRTSVWAAAQYLTYAIGTTPVDIRVNVEVSGFNTTQARCVLSRDEKEILTAHVALGSRNLPYERTWAVMPDVPMPADCPPFGFFDRSARNLGGLVEIRSAKGRQLAEIKAEGTPSDGMSAMWFRCWKGSRVPSVGELALIGDFMPLGFPHAMGLPYVGNSLDNTIRIGNVEATECSR